MLEFACELSGLMWSVGLLLSLTETAIEIECDGIIIVK
jgi:hypothetical protein